jgi:hypothetical protein
VVANSTHLYNQLVSTYYRTGGTNIALGDGGTNSDLTAVSGGVVYSNATGLAITSTATAGWVLTSGGAGGIPQWTNPTSLSVGSASSITGYSITAASTAGTIAARNGDGDLVARLFRSEFADQATMSGALAFRVNNSTDNYIRYISSSSAVRTWLGLGTFATKDLTYSTSTPSGGTAGDVHLQYVA